MTQNILYEYTVKETIGTGTFSKVKLGIRKATGEKVAIKILDKSKIKTIPDKQRVERELNILKKINHINIIKIIQTKEGINNIYIIMEYIDNDLFLHIVNSRRLDEKESALYYFQLITGLEYLHFLNIVHRDLKPENLLLTKNKILKIIDFGLSNYFVGEKLLCTPCGSPSYTPPEMIKGDKYNGYAVDIWSSGIILYGMLCGHLPFEDKDNKALFKKILKCKVNYPKFISNNAINLMKRILVENPEKRITIQEIKKHPFFLEGKNIFYQKHPGLIEKLEKYSNNPSINNIFNINNNNFNIITNTNNHSRNQNNYNINDIKMINNTAPENNDNNCNVNINGNDKVSSRFRSRILGPNFDLLKKILRGSRSNTNEKNIKNNNSKRNGSMHIKHKGLEKTKVIYSPMKLIQKIMKEKKKYLSKPQYSERREKKNLYRQKYRNIEYSFDYDNEKNMELFTNTCSNLIYPNSDVNRKKEYEESIKAKKIKSFFSLNNNRKRNIKKNNDYSFPKDCFNPRKVNTFCNYGKKKKMSLNNSSLSRNNKSKTTLANKRSDNSINWKFEALPIIHDSFFNLNKNKNRNKSNNNNDNKTSFTMKSYIVNKTKAKIKNNNKSIKTTNRSKSKNMTKINNNFNFNKKKITGSPHYSWLSKKIISVNNLYNSIQNKYDRINTGSNNHTDTIENIENINNLNKNRSSKTEERRRRSNNNENITFYQSFFRNRLDSFKIATNNNNSNNNVKDFKRCSFNTIDVEPKINNDNNNDNSSNICLFKNSKRNIIAFLTKNRKRNKNKKIINDCNGDKYNIKDIIEKRRLNKYYNK